MIPGRLRLSVFLGVLCGFAPEATAETIDGKVRDTSGVAVARAEVALTTAELTVVAATRTDDQGSFSLTAPVAGRYLLIVRAPAFHEARLAVNATPGAAATVDVVLQVAPLSEEITVSASRQRVETMRLAPQPVSVIGSDDIGDRVKTVVAQAVEGEAGVALQRTSPTMAGVFVRGLTGNKVNVFVDGVRYSNGAQRGGVNTFLDLIEPDGLESIEVLRGPSSAQYGSDALGGSIQFYLETARRRQSRRLALAHQPERRRRLGTSIRRRLGSSRLYRPVPGRDGLVERPSSRGDSHGERHRFARGRHAVSRPRFRCVDGRSASRHRVPPGGRRRAVQLDSESEHQRGRLLHAHGPGRRQALRPVAGRRRQPDLRPRRSVPRSGLGAPRAAPPRSVFPRLVHVFVQQPARGARQPGRQRQSDGNDRPRARTHLCPRPADVAHQGVFTARDHDLRRRREHRRADVGVVQRQPGHGRHHAAASARSRWRVVRAGRRLRAGEHRSDARLAAPDRRAALWRCALRGQGVRQPAAEHRAAVARRFAVS